MEAVRDHHLLALDVDLVDVAAKKIHAPDHFSDGIDDIGQIQIARRDLVQHRPAGQAGPGGRLLSADLGVLDPIARRPRLAALLGAICISFSGVFYVFAAVSPSTGTFYRAVFGLPLLVAVAYSERRRFGPLSRQAVLLAAIAGVFFTGDLTFWHHSIEAVGAGLGTVLGNLQVVIVGLVLSGVIVIVLPETQYE